jgi:hypothetical protein
MAFGGTFMCTEQRLGLDQGHARSNAVAQAAPAGGDDGANTTLGLDHEDGAPGDPARQAVVERTDMLRCILWHRMRQVVGNPDPRHGSRMTPATFSATFRSTPIDSRRIERLRWQESTSLSIRLSTRLPTRLPTASSICFPSSWVDVAAAPLDRARLGP